MRWGWAFLVPAGLRRWWPSLAAATFLALGLLPGLATRAPVLAVTRDGSSEQVVQRVALLARPRNRRRSGCLGPRLLALRYAQTFRGELPGLALVDHNAPVTALIAAGQRLVTPQETFYVFAPDWWRDHLGSLALSSAGDGLVQVSPTLKKAEAKPTGAVSLGQGVAVAEAAVSWVGDDVLAVRVRWLAEAVPSADLSVAVHLIGWPAGSATSGVLSQADSQHPVYAGPHLDLAAGAHPGRLSPHSGPGRARSVRCACSCTPTTMCFHNSDAVTSPYPDVPAHMAMTTVRTATGRQHVMPPHDQDRERDHRGGKLVSSPSLPA